MLGPTRIRIIINYLTVVRRADNTKNRQPVSPDPEEEEAEADTGA